MFIQNTQRIRTFLSCKLNNINFYSPGIPTNAHHDYNRKKSALGTYAEAEGNVEAEIVNADTPESGRA